MHGARILHKPGRLKHLLSKTAILTLVQTDLIFLYDIQAEADVMDHVFDNFNVLKFFKSGLQNLI